MSTDLLRSCLLAAAEAVESARDELCRLDAAAGDGDHGVTMALAARGVREQLAAPPPDSNAELLSRVALAVGSVGGAIGPLYASGLVAIATTMRGAPSGAPLSVDVVVTCAQAAEVAISKLGRAAPGDKTILDALHPAVESFHQARSAGATVVAALDEAAVAAREGAAATAPMTATIGRASRLGERSRGLADPGASSFSLILTAVAAAYGRESAGRGQ
ncbi:MAG: DAK2 domain-containing protein [Candidatus Dormibacteraceae bacterium]